LARELNLLDLPGVVFSPLEFTPTASKFETELCHGVAIRITDRQQFDAIRTGLEIARQLQRNYPQQWDIDSYIKLLGSESVLEAIRDGRNYLEIRTIYGPGLEAFKHRRQLYLIYP
jgi:uncharacterized protein YbbC (DUF1343 family)